jgi:RNA-binding protein 39
MTSTNPKSANEVEDFLNEMAKEVQVKTESKNKTEADDLERSPRNNGVNDERSDRRGDRYDHRPRYPQQRELNGERPSSREGTRRDGSRARSNKDADTEEDRARNNRRSSSFERRRGDRGDRRAGGRGGDYYNGGGGGRRDRTRSPRRDRDRDRDYRGRGDRGYRERSRDRRLDRDDNRRGGPRRRTPTPEASEDDRDKRTIFVQQISQRAETRHLLEFFRVVGPVIDAQIVKDRVTGRSKGYVIYRTLCSFSNSLQGRLCRVQGR